MQDAPETTARERWRMAHGDDVRDIFVVYYGDGAILDAAEAVSDLRPLKHWDEPVVRTLWTGVPSDVADKIIGYADRNRAGLRDGYEAAKILKKSDGTGTVQYDAAGPHLETVLHATGVGV